MIEMRGVVIIMMIITHGVVEVAEGKIGEEEDLQEMTGNGVMIGETMNGIAGTVTISMEEEVRAVAEAVEAGAGVGAGITTDTIIEALNTAEDHHPECTVILDLRDHLYLRHHHTASLPEDLPLLRHRHR